MSEPQWMSWPSVIRLGELLTSRGAEYAFVGGALRDAAMNRTPRDIDVVTSLAASECIALFEEAGLFPNTLNTHLQIIAVTLEGTQFDIIPLEKRAAADNSKAPFTEAVRLFAANSDFTINSLAYIPSIGLRDEHDGLADIHAGRVRFTGSADACIMADPVCIVRYFRFYTYFGKDTPDEKALAACREHRGLLSRLWGSRIRREMFRLLAAPSCYRTLCMMQTYGFLGDILGCDIADCELIKSLETIESLRDVTPKAYLRLLLLLFKARMDVKDAFAQLEKRWNLSTQERAEIDPLLAPMKSLDPQSSASVQEQLIRILGIAAYRDMLLLTWAMEDDVEATRSFYESVL